MEILKQIFSNHCPSCKKGKVYDAFMKINQSCSSCSYLFNKGEGFWIMSWIFNYSIAAFILIPLFIVLVALEAPFLAVIAVPLITLLIIEPFLIHYCRLYWLYLDFIRNNTLGKA